MSLGTRLDKAMTTLSAQERGILVLRSLKEKTPEDPVWRATMPRTQTAEFNRYIELMNVANMHLAHLITFIEGGVDALNLRFVWFLTLRGWQLNVAEIDYAASHLVREPITESAHRKLVEKGQNEYVPVMKLAETLAGEQRGWSDEDLETVPWSGDSIVKGDAWKRLVKRAAAQLISAAAEGDLDSRDRKKLKIRRGSFDALLERQPTVYPSWAGGWDIRPDADAARVEGDRRTLAHLQLALEKPFRQPGDGRKDLDGVIDAVRSRLESGLQARWCDVRVVEIELERIAGEFGGEDPLKPATREALDESRRTLLDLSSYLSLQDKTIELMEPSDEELEEFKEAIERGQQLFR